MLLKLTSPLLLLALFAACGSDEGRADSNPGSEEEKASEEKEFALPVRAVAPLRKEVESVVESQATLASDVFAEIVAEIDGRVTKRLRDVGDRVGAGSGGEDPYLLAQLDDREWRVALREAEATIEEMTVRKRELGLAREQALREVEQAKVEQAEAEAARKRTSTGILDGTISKEEHEKATFALDLARTKVAAAEAAVEKADVALELGGVAVRQAELARDRAQLNVDRTALRSPIAGVVTRCDVQPGERVKPSEAVYRVEDPSQLVVYGNLPVRQAGRIRVGNFVRISSSATPAETEGRVKRIAPTVDPTSGTVRVKIAVTSGEGYKPGLFVTLRVVVETREKALTVPKRAVLHDDNDGAYMFVVNQDVAARVLVETGFEKDGRVEIVKGIDDSSLVVIEGQDTLTDGAKVERLREAESDESGAKPVDTTKGD